MKTFPTLIQTDGMLCGVTCLRMICEWYGKKYSTDFLNKYCNASSQGVSLLGTVVLLWKLAIIILLSKRKVFIIILLKFNLS